MTTSSYAIDEFAHDMEGLLRGQPDQEKIFDRGSSYLDRLFNNPSAIPTEYRVPSETGPRDDGRVLKRGAHVVRGYAWSGAGAISQVDVSVDGGESWGPARLEEPRDRFMWVRWSFSWDVDAPGTYSIMSRATDEVGRVQSRESRYNYMRKNFSAIVGNEVSVG